MSERKSAAAPIPAMLAIVLPLAMYVAGYFWLGKREEFFFSMSTLSGRIPSYVARDYGHRWLATIYAPAGTLEAYWIDGSVVIEPSGKQAAP